LLIVYRPYKNRARVGAYDVPMFSGYKRLHVHQRMANCVA